MEGIYTVITLAHASLELHIKLQAVTFHSMYLFKMATFLELVEVKLSWAAHYGHLYGALFLHKFSYNNEIS